MLVHIIESCPAVHSRFIPKPNNAHRGTADAPSSTNDDDERILALEEILSDDASILPFGITCINITDMLAKFLLFSKAIDKMDALLSAKPFWKMFVDPNALLILQEVSLDLLCDVCVEIGRERRIRKLAERAGGGGTDGGGRDAQKKTGGGGMMPGRRDGKVRRMETNLRGCVRKRVLSPPRGRFPRFRIASRHLFIALAPPFRHPPPPRKVTVFDFSEIMERTEKRVGEEVLGAGPQDVDELRAVALKVKSKYLYRIAVKEKHGIGGNGPSSPSGKKIPVPMPTVPMPSKESMLNVTHTVIGGVAGGFASLLKRGDSSSRGAAAAVEDGRGQSGPSADEIDFDFASNGTHKYSHETDGQEVEVDLDGTTSGPGENLFGGSPMSPASPFSPSPADPSDEIKATTPGYEVDELDKLSSELGELSAVSLEAFDLLGDDFDMTNLDAMDQRVDSFSAFNIDDDNDFLSS
jgi:hypothetical protein